MNCLRCPLCYELLVENDKGLACANRHQFDRAREGYFHLLPVQNKGSREPGDGKLQLQARRLFLRAGFFSPLKYKLQSLLPENTIQLNAIQLLDVGCGEGYFTEAFAELIPNATVYGLDISKAGIKLAAKGMAGRKIIYTVASSVELPFADSSMDVITRIYAPSKDEELLRVLKPDGLLMIVTPGERHLMNLRQQIYSKVRPHSAPHVPAGFVPAGEHEVITELNLPGGEFADALLTMTPFTWRMTSKLREQIIFDGLSDCLHFNINLYHPDPMSPKMANA